MTQTLTLVPDMPDPRHDLVPVGWWQTVAVPIVDRANTWAQVEALELEIQTWINYAEALGGAPLYEMRAAMRYVEKRKGELLSPRRPGSRTDLEPRPRVVEVEVVGDDVPADLSNGTATRLRTIAENWSTVILPHIEASQGNPAAVTQTQCLNRVREHTPAKPDVDLLNTEAAAGRWSVRHGDFRDVLTDLPDGSVDLIVTDPPYPKEDLPIWSDLAKVAARVLGPRGILFAWSGQMYLPEVLNRLGEHLTYGWTFCLELPGSGSRIMGRHVIQAWKPVVAFSTGTWPSGKWGDDLLISPARDKTEYEWQQNAAPARWLIERYSAPDGLIVDPFLGSGAFGLAALETGRRFLGVELDADRYAKSIERIREGEQ